MKYIWPKNKKVGSTPVEIEVSTSNYFVSVDERLASYAKNKIDAEFEEHQNSSSVSEAGKKLNRD